MARRRVSLEEIPLEMRGPPPEPEPEPESETLPVRYAPDEVIRVEAKALFVTAIDRPELVDIWRHPSINRAIPLDTLERWALEDDWVGARKTLYGEITTRLEGELRGRLIDEVNKTRLAQKEVLRKVTKRLTKGALRAEVKSAEGGARAIVELLRMQNKLDREIVRDLQETVSLGSAITGAAPKPLEARTGFTQQEILDASRHILRMRRVADDADNPDASPDGSEPDASPEAAEKGDPTPRDPETP